MCKNLPHVEKVSKLVKKRANVIVINNKSYQIGKFLFMKAPASSLLMTMQLLHIMSLQLLYWL